MRSRHLSYIYVALIVVTQPVFGQDTQDTQDEQPKAQSTSTEQTPSPGASTAPVRQMPRAAPSPTGYGYRPTRKRPPAAQYSPLAAAGGYGRTGVTPWQAIVNYFNPHHLNMGQLFAERKQAWLDNALYNQYFWYSFWVTGLLILSWFAIAWIHNDRVRANWELAECASDALRYSEYCKHEAKEAIRRHNDHIEKCNRIIEDNRSGLMTTPETADLEFRKQELARLRNDNDSKTLQLERVQAELDNKNKQLSEFSARLEAVEHHAQRTGSPNAAAALAERISRLEVENASLTEDNKRLRQVAKEGQRQNGQKANGNLESRADVSKC
jgi:hypothetical protein